MSYPVGEGWYDLVHPVVEKADEEGAEIFQVKEKFGGLRIYIKDHDEMSDELENMIAEAESKSLKTCEECGGSGSLVGVGGWIKTLCPSCHHKFEQDLP